MYTINLYILSSMSFLIDRCDLRVVTRENGFVSARERKSGVIVSVCMQVRVRGRERGGKYVGEDNYAEKPY